MTSEKTETRRRYRAAIGLWRYPQQLSPLVDKRTARARGGWRKDGRCQARHRAGAPQGALVYFTAAFHRQKTIENEQSLIIDPGSRTFDWPLYRGMRLVLKVSSSVNRGMSDVLKTIAQEISTDIGRPYSDLPAIDAALRTGKPRSPATLRLFCQRPCQWPGAQCRP